MKKIYIIVLSFILIIFFVLLFFFRGFISEYIYIQSNELVRNYLEIPRSKRHHKFKEYSIKEQYELFIFSNQIIHPPMISLANIFVKQRGKILVPFLVKKLKETKNEVTIRDIFLLFSRLSENKSYDFSKDPELLDLLEKKINGMQGIWKDTTFKMFLEIKNSIP